MTFLMGIEHVPRRLSFGIGRRIEILLELVEAPLERHRRKDEYRIEVADGSITDVERYWTRHTVNSTPFASARGSLRYLRWRSKEYPLFHPLMELWEDHRADVVLDYGCGPGNDLTGFLVESRARKVIGIDVSMTALELARRRIALHAVDPERVRLIKASDAVPTIPLSDRSVDHIYSQGVLHHTSHPAEILAEFHRVLRPGCRALVMVYNAHSVFLHLYVAYKRQILDGVDRDENVELAFSRNTDGREVPTSRPYQPAEFLAMSEKAGFEATFRGGYFYRHEELRLLHRLRKQAITDPRLGQSHRDFLERLRFDDVHPYLDGRSAGIGGVYELRKSR